MVLLPAARASPALFSQPIAFLSCPVHSPFNLSFIPFREPPLTSTVSAQSCLGIPEMALEFCPHLPHGHDLAWSAGLLDSAHDYVMRLFTLSLHCLWELSPSGKCKGRDHCGTSYLHFLFISIILSKIGTALWGRSSWFKDAKPRLSASGMRHSCWCSSSSRQVDPAP